MIDHETDYYARIATISAEMVEAMRFRMTMAGDYRPLYVYVSPTDGGHTIGHEGQHTGYWRSDTPITAATSYTRVSMILADALRRAPLYAGTTS